MLTFLLLQGALPWHEYTETFHLTDISQCMYKYSCIQPPGTWHHQFIKSINSICNNNRFFFISFWHSLDNTIYTQAWHPIILLQLVTTNLVPATNSLLYQWRISLMKGPRGNGMDMPLTLTLYAYLLHLWHLCDWFLQVFDKLEQLLSTLGTEIKYLFLVWAKWWEDGNTMGIVWGAAHWVIDTKV